MPSPVVCVLIIEVYNIIPIQHLIDVLSILVIEICEFSGIIVKFGDQFIEDSFQLRVSLVTGLIGLASLE